MPSNDNSALTSESERLREPHFQKSVIIYQRLTPGSGMFLTENAEGVLYIFVYFVYSLRVSYMFFSEYPAQLRLF